MAYLIYHRPQIDVELYVRSTNIVRSDKLVLCSVGVDVGDVCGNDVGQNMGKVLHI